jgi:Zn finger protein HypA/HybF involved in hydrogenase expression
MTCQDNIRRAIEIRDGRFEKIEIEYDKCQRCGSAFTKSQDNQYCESCKKKISEFKPNNPFSRRYGNFFSNAPNKMDSDHYG